MFDFDINNPNEYVAEGTLPKGTIGKGGLSAMADASRGSPQQPNSRLLGGLQGEHSQAELENILFPRIRNTEQLDTARSSRRSRLAELQSSLKKPIDEMTGIDYLLYGMMTNDKPYDSRAGLRKGIAAGMEARMARSKATKDGEVAAAKVGLDFEKSEGDNDDQLEQTAISNLRTLAKPILDRGFGGRSASGGRSGSGSRFRWVPGTGYVDTETLDEQGVPKVVFDDPRLAIQARTVARKSAEKEVESNLHKITFKTAEEREQYIEDRASGIVGELLGATNPQAPSAAAPVRPSKPTGGATKAQAAPGKVPDWRNPAGEEGRMEIFRTEEADIKSKLAAEKDPARKRSLEADLAAVRNEMKAVSPNYELETPDVQAGKTKTAEKLAESQVEYASKLRSDAETGMKIIGAVNELKQLKFDPGAFAKWKQKGGNILEALGSEGPLARAAAQSGNAEAILQNLSNARISLEKGVQTRDDEIRFKAEIARITDPKQGYEYMLKYMTEMANKSIEQQNYVESYRKQKGTYDGAEIAWQKRNQQFGGVVKRYQGSFIGRSEFIKAIVNNPANKKAYAGDESKLLERAEREWNALGGAK